MRISSSRKTGASSYRMRSAGLALAAGLLVVAWPLGAQVTCGTPGKDGPGGTLTGIVNTYYPGTGSASAGATSLTVGAAIAGTAQVTAGDLLLVMQVQDASINSTNSTAYGGNTGTGRGSTSLGNSGRYEYVRATSTTSLLGGTISFVGTGAGSGLLWSYATAAPTGTQGQRTFQVIRVPQYSSATFSSGLTAYPWDGRVGGVLAVDVAGPLTLGGTVSVTGMGFRGGAGRQLQGTTPRGFNTDYVNLATTPFHGSKGEGIAGTPRFVLTGLTAATWSLLNTGLEGYPNGSTARGAPGNAGGGGTDGDSLVNQENSGGGGGAGAGAGGQGGRSWSSSLNIGGRGGVAFTVAFDRLALGGGGGAGTTNNGTGTPGAGLASSGAAGGGIVMVRADTVRGTGTIAANGADANQTTGIDGSGGGGGGGSILFYVARGTLGGLTATATGGRGGNNAPSGPDHGPGGGGGGGYIATSAAAASLSVGGGANGVTSGSNAYAAASGGAGLTSTALLVTSMPGVQPNAACIPRLTVTKRTLTASVVAGDTARYEITVSNAAGRNTATGVVVRDTLATGFTFSSGATATFTGGASRPATVDPAVGATIPAFGTFSVPGGGSVVLTFSVRIASSTTAGVKQNGAIAGHALAPGDTTWSVYASASTTNDDITVTGAVDVRATKAHTGNVAVGRAVNFSLTVPNAGTVATSGTITVIDTLPTGLSYVSGTGPNWACSAAAGVVTCTSSQVVAAGGTSSTLTVRTNVAPAAAPRVINTARVSLAAEAVANRANNAGVDTVAVIPPGVRVTPDSSVVTRLPSNGTQYTQAFTVLNLGVVRDTFTLAALKLPGTTLALVSVNGVAGTAGTVILDSAATATVTVTYTVGAAAAGTIDTLALRATSKQDPARIDRGDWDVQVVRAAITMTKVAYRDDGVTLIGPTDRVLPGEYLRYRVSVTSAGGADATAVVVTDTLPGGVTFDSATGDAAGWSFTTVPPGTVTGTLAGTLPVGQVRYFWVRARVN